MSLPFLAAQVALLSSPNQPPLFLAVPQSSACCSKLFLVSLPDGRVEKIALGDGGACVVVGPDGMAYLGTHAGRLLRFNPAEKTLTEAMPPLEGDQFLVGFRSNTGKLFFGSSPSGVVVEYDPVSGTGAHYYHWRSDKRHPQHAHAFADLPDGRVVAFLSGANHAYLTLTPDTDEAWERGEIAGLAGERAIQYVVPFDKDTLLISTQPGRRLFLLDILTLDVLSPFPPLPDDDSIYDMDRVGDSLVATGVSGSVYHATQAGWERLAMPMPNDPFRFAASPDDRLVGISYQGRLLQSATDHRMYTVSSVPTRELDGLPIAAMGASPDRKLYFSLAHNMRLGTWDPDEDDITERFIAAPFPGEVSALGYAGERLLLACADTGCVMAYYPELPYRLMENPRLLGVADTVQRRPLGPMVHHESDVYFAAAAVAHDQEGAIIRVNPLDNEITAFPGVIPGENVTSLVADRLSGLLAVGGQLQMAYRHQGVDEQAHLALWSPYQETTIRMVAPFFDGAMVRVWAAEGGRIYVTDGGARLAILSSDGDIIEVSEFPLGTITALMTNQEGRLYGLAGGWLFHLDAEQGQVERLVQATGSFLTEVRRGLLAFADGARITTVQLW